MTIARDLATFVMRQSYLDFPPKAIEYSEMLIASTLASAAMGTTLESSKIMRELEVERGGSPESTIWFGTPNKLPMASAARVNALMSDAAASDDSDLRYIIHQGTTVCASALAVAEKTGSTGEDILAAIILGYEVSSRLIGAMGYSFKEKGVHGCVVACFSGGIAAARLMNLTEAQTAQTIALTATSVGGLSAAANTSWAREYHAGLAAMLGVQAAQAARRGFIAEEGILEIPGGYLDVHSADPDIPSITQDLGGRWGILTEMGIKLVPGGHPYHAIAEAAANASSAGNVLVDDVEAITISRPGFQGFGNTQFPTDLIGIAHSPAYFAAAGVVDRSFTWEHASEKKINAPAIRSLLNKVRLTGPPTKDVDRFKSGAIVTIKTKDGRSYSNTVFMPRGAAILGISWVEIEAKYRALMPYGKLSDNSLEASLAVIRRFRHLKNVSELISFLR